MLFFLWVEVDKLFKKCYYYDRYGVDGRTK